MIPATFLCRRLHEVRLRWIPVVRTSCLGVLLAACASLGAHTNGPDATLEEIFVLRSIREPHAATSNACPASQTGFDPFQTDAERFYAFWSVHSRRENGRVVDAHGARVAELRGCFGATTDRARQNFYAEIRIGALSFRGSGECLALRIDFPEPGLFPVRCQLILSGLPAPYVGGVLTTNTVTSRAAFGADSDPSGYTQASIATIRLWKERKP